MSRSRGPEQPLIVAGVCFIEATDRLLVVRKRGTVRFMLPGGKLEPGESAEDAARRECAEEIGITVAPVQLRLFGSWRGDAANEDGHTIEATVFLADLDTDPVISREIDEARWLSIREPEAVPLAPLLEEFVLPELGRRLTARPWTAMVDRTG